MIRWEIRKVLEMIGAPGGISLKMRKLFYRYTGAVSQMTDPMGDDSDSPFFSPRFI